MVQGLQPQGVMTANYVDSVREAEPIEVFEDTEADFARFAHDWARRALDARRDNSDEDLSFGDLPHYSTAHKAERHFNFARRNVVVFRLPGWFASDELGQWESLWFGTFEVAKEDDDGEWTAMCLSDIEPFDDRNEERYFRDPVDEEWFPVSLVEWAFTVEQPLSDDELVFEAGGDPEQDFRRGTKENADIVLTGPKQTRYGRKFAFDSPFEAKDDINDLDWDHFHQNWTGEEWRFDTEALWQFIGEMVDAGWSVGVSGLVENETTSDTLNDAAFLPHNVRND